MVQIEQKSIYSGMAGLRDYNVKEWIELRETVVITYTGPDEELKGEKMTLTSTQLKDEIIMKGSTFQHSRHGMKPYCLWYYIWTSNEEL